MPKDELPSLDDFTEKSVELPSVDEFITEEKVVEELPSVEEYVVDLEEKVIYEKPNLPSVEDKIVDENLPTIEDYIEEVEEEIETTGGISVQEYSPDMQFRDYEFIDIIKRPEWNELVGLVNEVRDNIPDIPEIKYYDDDLEKISETIEELRSEIPVVPEVKYYDEEIDEYCGPWSDLYVGGMTASVLIIIAAVMLFAAFFMQGRPDNLETSNYIAMGAGGLMIFALIFWHFMLPDAADNLDWVRGPWFAILSAGLSIAAGFIGYSQLKESDGQSS